MKGGSVVYVIALLLMACLAGGQCKHISLLAYHWFVYILAANLLENLFLVV
jgi:hypothetical protein